MFSSGLRNNYFACFALRFYEGQANNYCFSGYINSFLSWKGWVILSRLTFGAYLLHLTILQWLYNDVPRPFHYSRVSLVSHLFFRKQINLGRTQKREQRAQRTKSIVLHKHVNRKCTIRFCTLRKLKSSSRTFNI